MGLNPSPSRQRGRAAFLWVAEETNPELSSSPSPEPQELSHNKGGLVECVPPAPLNLREASTHTYTHPNLREASSY